MSDLSIWVLKYLDLDVFFSKLSKSSFLLEHDLAICQIDKWAEKKFIKVMDFFCHLYVVYPSVTCLFLPTCGFLPALPPRSPGDFRLLLLREFPGEVNIDPTTICIFEFFPLIFYF